MFVLILRATSLLHYSTCNSLEKRKGDGKNGKGRKLRHVVEDEEEDEEGAREEEAVRRTRSRQLSPWAREVSFEN